MNMDVEFRLKGNLAAWMEAHGIVISEENKSNEYVGVRILNLIWRGNRYEIVQVDGATTNIDLKQTLEERYKLAIRRLGGAEGIMKLPVNIQEVLKTITDLETKVNVMEMVLNFEFK